MALNLESTLAELVSLPSVNPMGRPVSGPEFLEYRVTDYLQALFERLGVRWQRQLVEPRRENIVARLDGEIPPERGGPVLLFEAHQDTVPVDGMTIEPWTPTVRDGRMYGRGSCDIKGGMTAMLGAFARLVEKRPRGLPTVLMACTVNEEHGFSGVRALARLWEAGCDSIFPRAPDAAIVAEPTGLQVVVAHKGAVRWSCRTHGRATHSSQPHLGENALYKMGHVLTAFEQYAAEVASSVPRHPLCGNATLSVGMISGGISVNTVPDLCTIEIDRRLLPGEDPQAAYQHAVQYFRQRGDMPAGIEHVAPSMQAPALPDGPNDGLAERLGAVATEVRGSCQRIGVPYGTDASSLAAVGVPTVVFGPGSIDQAHTADEWLELDQLAAAGEILHEFARRFDARLP